MNFNENILKSIIGKIAFFNKNSVLFRFIFISLTLLSNFLKNLIIIQMFEFIFKILEYVYFIFTIVKELSVVKDLMNGFEVVNQLCIVII